jgi:hypothetical protein
MSALNLNFTFSHYRMHVGSLALTAALLLTAEMSQGSSANAATFSVDCSKGQTISAALERGSTGKPLLVLFKGTCTEQVTIARDDVTLQGGDPERGATVVGPNPGTDVIVLTGNRIRLENLTVTGGNNGIRVQGMFNVDLLEVVVVGAATNGVLVRAGEVSITGSRVEQAGFHGLNLQRQASARVVESAFLNNHAAGIMVQQGSSVAATYGVMAENGANGILITTGSQATVIGSSVFRNGSDGIVAYLGSILILRGGDVIFNEGSGVVGNANATLQMVGVHTYSNHGDGIVLIRGSKLILEEPGSDSNGNNFGLYCDDESSVNNLNLLNFKGNFNDTVACTAY